MFNLKDVAGNTPARSASDPAEAPRAGRQTVAREGQAADVKLPLAEIGFAAPVKVRDLWKKQDIGSFTNEFSRTIPYHGAGLYRLTPR